MRHYATILLAPISKSVYCEADEVFASRRHELKTCASVCLINQRIKKNLVFVFYSNLSNSE